MRYKKIGMPNFFIQHSSLGIFLILQITTAQRFQKQILARLNIAAKKYNREPSQMQMPNFIPTKVPNPST